MQVPLQISFTGLEPSPALESRARAKAEKLEQFFSGIISCHVTIESPHHHRHSGRRYQVRIRVCVPGREIEVSRGADNPAHEDAYVALRDAFDAAARQVEDYARQRRGDVKRHAGRAG
jgi:ribosome-associated translation inhibitor RaiA